MTTAASSREIAEVQAALTIAAARPRDMEVVFEKVMDACKRPSLAERAIYEYARGGTDISGPSIRLAEALAQAYGNLTFGIRELEQKNGVSTVEAFAWDLETNTKQVKTFQVTHRRHTRKGGYDLTDPRDIYERVANDGARRMRSCLLGIMPGDLVDEAVLTCTKTLIESAKITPDLKVKIVAQFKGLGVSLEQIEVLIQRSFESITPQNVVRLRNIMTSITDGMSTAKDWFPPIETEKPPGEEEPAKKGAELAKEKVRKAKVEVEPEAPVAEEPDHPPFDVETGEITGEEPSQEEEAANDSDEQTRQLWIANISDNMGKLSPKEQLDVIANTSAATDNPRRFSN